MKVVAKYSPYRNKEYFGLIQSVASRVDAQTRSILASAKIENPEGEIIPGSLLEISINLSKKSRIFLEICRIVLEISRKF